MDRRPRPVGDQAASRNGHGAPELLRPVWLLDVDGVLNATRPGWGGPPETRTAYAHTMAFRMQFAPALIRRIRALHELGSVEVRWATTWVDHIDQIVTTMSLPAWSCAFTLEQPDADAEAAKYAAALHVVEIERRPLIWTDDEAIPADDSHLYRRLIAAGLPLLLIRPRSHRGLQPDHLDQIQAFLAT